MLATRPARRARVGGKSATGLPALAARSGDRGTPEIARWPAGIAASSDRVPGFGGGVK